MYKCNSLAEEKMTSFPLITFKLHSHMCKVILSLFFIILMQRVGEEKSNRSGNIFLTENISLTTLLWQGHLLFGRRFLQRIL